MIEYLVDDFVIWAYRNKLLMNYKNRDVYEYAVIFNICVLFMFIIQKLIEILNLSVKVER